MVEFAVHPGTVLLARIAAEGNRDADRPPSGAAFVQVLSGCDRICRFAPFVPSGPTKPLTGDPISYAATPRSQLLITAQNRANASIRVGTWQTIFENHRAHFSIPQCRSVATAFRDDSANANYVRHRITAL